MSSWRVKPNPRVLEAAIAEFVRRFREGSASNAAAAG